MLFYASKLIADISRSSKNCDEIRFEELQVSLDKNYDLINSRFESITKLLNNLSSDMAIKEIGSNLSTIITAFKNKVAFIDNLNQKQKIVELARDQGLLWQLKMETNSATTDSVYKQINKIINEKLAVPITPKDTRAFDGLVLLCIGIDTYFENMRFLLQSETVLAGHYLQTNNIEAYNRHYTLYSNTLIEFIYIYIEW